MRIVRQNSLNFSSEVLFGSSIRMRRIISFSCKLTSQEKNRIVEGGILRSDKPQLTSKTAIIALWISFICDIQELCPSSERFKQGEEFILSGRGFLFQKLVVFQRVDLFYSSRYSLLPRLIRLIKLAICAYFYGID